MEWRTPKGIQGTQGQDNESTSSFPTKEGRKILSGNEHFRTCYKGSTIPRTRREMETDSVSIQDDTTGRKELWNLQQGATSNSRSLNQVKTIPVGHYGAFWSLDRSQKLEVFPRTSQVKQKTSKMVSKVARLWLHITTYSREDKYQSRYPIKKGLSKYKRG